MSDNDTGFVSPPRPRKSDGSPRRVGYELEFSGITLDAAATAVRSALGGTLTSPSAAERVVETERLGTVRNELDWAFLKRKAAEVSDTGERGDWVEQLSQAAARFVPVEVVCPPVPYDDLERLEPMVDALRAAGAVGTEESLLAAYGVHVNTEIPALEAATLFGYLRAYALLQWWLVDAHEVDATRRLSSYIDLYSQAYLKQTLTREQPSMDTLLSDYLEHNASRNRALDLLPILTEVDEQRVRSVIDDPRIKPRPAFHYRLPNCQIEKPDWRLSRSWNIWCVVERLAAREQDLDELSERFLAADRPLVGISRSDWVATIDRWLTDRELA